MSSGGFGNESKAAFIDLYLKLRKCSEPLSDRYEQILRAYKTCWSNGASEVGGVDAIDTELTTHQLLWLRTQLISEPSLDAILAKLRLSPLFKRDAGPAEKLARQIIALPRGMYLACGVTDDDARHIIETAIIHAIRPLPHTGKAKNDTVHREVKASTVVSRLAELMCPPFSFVCRPAPPGDSKSDPKRATPERTASSKPQASDKVKISGVGKSFEWKTTLVLSDEETAAEMRMLSLVL